jgi:hypothetical protein
MDLNREGRAPLAWLYLRAARLALFKIGADRVAPVLKIKLGVKETGSRRQALSIAAANGSDRETHASAEDRFSRIALKNPSADESG